MATRHSKRVLCIGSDAVNLNLRCAVLKEQGWNVLSPRSAHHGIIWFGQEQVDVVVVDLNDDGAEAALIIGELKKLRPKVPVVMLVTEGSTLASGATRQADAVVLKSNDARKLIDALETLLGPS